MQRALVTVLKADISGSTPLGEKLDPEELRGVLGAYFAALAREIQRHGGLVDKYIGDAVMAVFGLPAPHPDDAARATRAALAMQEAITRENEALAARYGVRLSLRIGVNTGELVGPDDGELTLMGDTVTTAERMEASAPLNTVLVSESTRRAAARRFRFDPGPAVTLKGQAGTVASYRPLVGRKRTADHAAASAGGAVSASLQVAGQRQHVLQEERKIVTILFADVSVAEGQLAPDAVRPVLGAYFGAVAREIQRFGGTIDKFVGDAVMAVFGAPISHDDDGSRAIAAGLAIQAAIARHNVELVREHGVRLAARVGVNTGEVVAGLLPGDVVAYTVTGDAVNTAQRIESVAPPGEVLVSESTYALARNAFVFESVAPLTLKGKANPVPAFRAIRRERRASVRGGTALVGRQDALDALYGFLRAAAAGRRQAVHVHGEAGVGKTRLVGEFLTGSGSASRLRARCSSYETETPYALVADLLRRVFGLQDTDDQETARAAVNKGLAILKLRAHESAAAALLEVLGYGAQTTLDPEAKRRLLTSVLRQLFKQRSAAGLLIVVLEDTHWIDPASAVTLTALIRTVTAMRCIVLSTSRDAASPWPAAALPLEPLGAASAEEMVDRVATVRLEPKIRQLVLERTGGNPFFIEEIVRSLNEGRSATVPTTVQELLEARVDALEPSPRFVAQRAAVIGRLFATRVLERVTPGEPLDATLDALEAARFVEPREPVPERMYAFRHALVQEVVYKTQLVAQRRRAHLAVGDAVSALYEGRLEEFVDALAYHYGRGDDDAKARTALLRAGQRAQRLYANDEALAYFEAALARSGEDGPSRAAADEGIGAVQRFQGKLAEAIESFERGITALGENDARGCARLGAKIAAIHRLRGARERALDILSTVLATLPEDADRERALVFLELAETQWHQGGFDAAIVSLESATAHAERARMPDCLAEAYKHLGTVHSLKGDIAGALEWYERSLTLFDELGDPSGQSKVLNNIGNAQRRQARYGEALDTYARSLEIKERLGDPLGIGAVQNNLAEVHRMLGDLDRAEGEYRASLEQFELIGVASGIALAHSGLGSNALDRGDRLAARTHFLEELGTSERLGQRASFAEPQRNIALTYIGEDPALAVEWAERAVASAREAAVPTQEALALQVLGIVRTARGETLEAIEALGRSRELLRGGDRHEVARTLAALGRAYAALAAGDPRRDDAPTLIAEARAIFTELGASLDLRRMDEPAPPPELQRDTERLQ